MTIREPVNALTTLRAFFDANWSTEAAAVNASITDNVELPTAWATMTFSGEGFRDATAWPVLQISASELRATGNGVSSTVAPADVSFTIEVVYGLRNPQTPLTGHGTADSADDLAHLLAWHVSGALRSLIFRALIGDPFFAGELEEIPPSIERDEGGNVLIEGRVVVPLGTERAHDAIREPLHPDADRRRDPPRPLDEAEHRELVARHGAELVATVYAREDDPIVARIRDVARSYADDPIGCQAEMRRLKRAPSDGGFDRAGFDAFEKRAKARAAEIERAEAEEGERMLAEFAAFEARAGAEHNPTEVGEIEDDETEA